MISGFATLLGGDDCRLCGLPGALPHLCEGCRDDLPHAAPGACPQCGEAGAGGAPCGRCLRDPPAFDQTVSAFDYRFPVDRLLHRYKYANDLSLAPLLAEDLIRHVTRRPAVDCVAAIPLAPARLRARGFNQALEIARRVARALQLPLDSKLLSKPAETAHQADLPFRDRARNIRGAFRCSTPLTGRTVALVDDVMTTGATLREAANTLRAAGAAGVVVWVVARAQRAV